MSQSSHITPISWENDLGERDLNTLLHQDPTNFLKTRLQKSEATSQDLRRRSNYLIKSQPKPFNRAPMLHLSKEKLDVLSIEDLRTFQKKKIRFTSSFSLSSPYIAEGFRHKPLEGTLANIKYCSKLDLYSFMAKRIKGKAFLKMRKFVLRFVKAVAHLDRAGNCQDKSLIHTRTLRNLTQSTPDDLVIQTLLRSLTLDTIFLTPRKRRTTRKAVNISHRRALDKILKSRDLESLTLKKESIKNLLQQQDEIQRLVKNLPNLKEFILGVNFEYRTFWCPQLRADIASRITSFNMRYKSSYSPVQEPKSPLFDFLDNIDAFKSLRSFRYEESDGIHWKHPEAANQLEKLEKFQNIPLKDFHMNLYFGGSQGPVIQQIMSGFFRNLALPDSLEKFSFYARVQDLNVLGKIHESSVPYFQTCRTLEHLNSFDLSIIANSMIVDFNLKEEQPEFLIQFFMKVLGNINPGLQDLRLTALKTTKCHTQKVYQDSELLTCIANRFQALNNLAIEFSDGAIELLCPPQAEILPVLRSLSIDGCKLPLALCQKLNPKELKELVYNAPRGIDLESLVEVLDGVSKLKWLKKVELVFAGCDKYDMRKEVFEGIVKILRDVEKLKEFTLYLDVHAKTNVLEWLLKFANLKKGLRFCRLNFYHYGTIKPLLITKEDYWIKTYMERSRRFLIN